MFPDRLDDVLVKVAGIAHEAASDVVCVLHAIEDGIDDGELGALTQLHLATLHIGVQVLDPVVVLDGQSLVDVVLEDDDVRV